MFIKTFVITEKMPLNPRPKLVLVRLSGAIEIITQGPNVLVIIKWINFHVTFYRYEFPRREVSYNLRLTFFPLFLVNHIDLYLSVYISRLSDYDYLFMLLTGVIKTFFSFLILYLFLFNFIPGQKISPVYIRYT